MAYDNPYEELLDQARRSRMSRRAMMRRATKVGLGASLAVALPAARPRLGRAQDKTQIRLATWAGAEENAELQLVLDEINAASTTFEIVSEPTPAEYLTRLQTTLAGGTGADLFWLSQEEIVPFAQEGALLDLTSHLESSEAPAANLDDYFPLILQTAQFDGGTYGLPWIAQPVVLYFNPALFDAAGVTYPDDTWDWPRFQEAAAQLTDPAQGVYGTSMNGWPPIEMFIWQAGGDVISEDLSACPIDSPEALTGAQFYADIAFNEEYAVPEAVIAEQGFGDMAKAGKVAMFFGGAADDLDYAHTKDPNNAEMRVALVPQGPQNRATFAWNASTVVNAATENPDLAVEALIALTEGIHHWKIVAPRQSLANVQTIAESVPDKAASAEIIVQAMADMRGFRIIPERQEWETLFTEEYETPLLQDEGSAEELASEIKPDLEELLPE